MSNPEAETNWIDISGSEPARVASEALGSGQPFIWGHALLTSMAMDEDNGVMAWRDLTDIARVIRYDARGHGRSDCNGEPEDFSWDNLGRNMWEVANTYVDPEEKVVLGGASMGCATALHAACQQPERVRGLVLVIPPLAWEWREPKRGGYRATAKLVRWTRGLPLKLLGKLPAKEVEGDFQKNAGAIMMKHLANADWRGIVGAMLGASLADFPGREELAALQMPVLILAWPGDERHPSVIAEELHRVLPNSQLEITERPDDPERWPERVRSFFATLK